MKAADETVLKAALLTPPGEGGISVIALWGPGAAEFAGGRLKTPGRRRCPLSEGRLSYGFFCDESGGILDEVIIACASQDDVEINCHGGALPVRRILADLAAAGVALETTRFAPSSPGERGALEREALEALFPAATDLAARVFAAQAGGALSRAVKEISEALSRGPACTGEAASGLAELDKSAALGLALARPADIAVVGPANAGKSTVVNALAGFERNIVSEVAGTTRDAVRVPAAFFGVPVVLVDTAGGGFEGASLGAEAASRASMAFQEADAALVVIDVSGPLPPGYRGAVNAKPAVIAANKADLGVDEGTLAALAGQGGRLVVTSALTGTGLAELQEALLSALGVGLPAKGAAAGAVVFTQRQLDCIRAASQALGAGDLRQARRALSACIDGR